MARERPISSLVLAELYDSADGRFLEEISKVPENAKAFVGVIERWKKDTRPWARRLRIEYVKQNWPRESPRLIYKRLFKQAWHDADHELMAAFLVQFDRMIRRKRSKRYRWDAGAVEIREVLVVPPSSNPSRFSIRTRHYMRRRAWCYFRKLGHKQPADYLPAISNALLQYTDDDVRAGENLLDNWGLMHACFGKSDQLIFTARHTNILSDGSLSQMSAAPRFEKLWKKSEGFSTLLALVVEAQSRTIRVWAIQLLKHLHAGRLPSISAQTLLSLIDHHDSDVSTFGADLLENSETVGSFPMQTWMELLNAKNPIVVEKIATAFRRFVTFERVTLSQAVELASRVSVPVATLGLEILQSREFRKAEEFDQLANLARARCAAVGEQIARFALSFLNRSGIYQVDQVIGFFDSALQSMRDGAFSQLQPGTPAEVDPAFWARLFESPYDDVRQQLVARLQERTTIPGASIDSLALLWRMVLLNIHRGGRTKLIALRQISDRAMADATNAKSILPILVIAIRSVRQPEVRHGLAAIVTILERSPELRDEVKRLLPELELDAVGAA